MELHINRKFKSLRPIQIELPDFTVLTGLNGSGKTQILENIAGHRLDNRLPYRRSHDQFERPVTLKVGGEVQNVRYVNLDSSIEQTGNVETKNVSHIWQEYNQARRFSSWQTSDKALYDEVAQRAQKSVENLEEKDFKVYLPVGRQNKPYNVFQRDFSALFNLYLKQYEDNNYKNFRLANGATNQDLLLEDEFVRLHGDGPWNLLNDIFIKADIGYHVEVPNLQNYDRDSNYIFKLKNKNGDEIDVNDLSSGERVIFSLIFAMYNAEFDVDFPQVLLMDEPDSSLHPIWIKQLVDVMLDLFVKQKGVKIIMTTHSPSTVAICPEESIYVVNKEGVQIEKISKNDALKILTSGIPTLSIDYKGHKQVIVESPTDVHYYQTLHNKLVQNENQDDRLYFISNGYGKGNCQQVIDIATAFRKSANQAVYGIVDWDNVGRNNLNPYVLIHGQGKRYSIENYVLDPMYIVCYFIEVKAKNVAKELNFDESYNQYSIGDESNDRLQQISDWVFNKFYEKLPAYKNKSQLKNVEYYNNKSYNLPVWYLEAQGHKVIVPLLQKVFGALDTPKFKSEGELQKTLTNIIGKCFPFVPSETINLLKGLY